MSRQKFCLLSFVSNTCLSRQNRYFVATKVCLSRQNVCRDKHVFVATNICGKKKYFVATKLRLSRQKFRRGKHTFVATKMVLVAAPANDISAASDQPQPTDTTSAASDNDGVAMAEASRATPTEARKQPTTTKVQSLRRRQNCAARLILKKNP